MKHKGKRGMAALCMAWLLSFISTTAMAATATVDVSALVLRKEASTSSKALQTLSAGDRMEIICEDGSWYKVQYGKYTGYVMTKYVKTSGTVSGKTNSDSLRYGDRGDDVKELQERLKKLGYYTGSIDGKYGSGTEKAVRSFQERNGLTADGVAGKKTLAALEASSAVGNESSNSTAAFSLKTNQTLRPGDRGSQVKALQEHLRELGYYSLSIDGKYGDGTYQGVLRFQTNNGLEQDGIAGRLTLGKLVSSSAVAADDASSGSCVTERLDWFKDGEDTFPRGATITIKDCKTGLYFNARVLYGSNHLDAEPLTSQDTETLLKINGGHEFSYERRAILVKYDGHVYAASIYSEPHGDQVITDNDYDGQFCIHFYGSKTHGSDRVDEDHQDCEAAALKYTW